MPEGEPLSRRRTDRREQLLDKIVEVIRANGPFVSMEQVASGCGITKPILYRHLGDRDEMVLAVAHRFVDELMAVLAPAVQDDAAPRDLLRQTIDAYLALVERDTNLYRFLSLQAGADRRDLLASLVAEEVAVVVSRETGEQGLPSGAAKAWSYGLVGMVHFAGDWWVEHRDELDERNTLVENLMTLSWDGLSSLLDDASPADPTPTDRDTSGGSR